MAEVNIAVNGHAYKVSCENGQEARLTQLGAYFDRQVAKLAGEVGQIGDARLMLLAALTVCDELFETRRRLSELERDAAPLKPETAAGAARLVGEAAERVAMMADRAARA